MAFMVRILAKNGHYPVPQLVICVYKAFIKRIGKRISNSSYDRIARKVGFSIKGSILNLDGMFDSKKNRKQIFNRSMIPNIPISKRNRKKTKRGRKRIFDEGIHELRLTVKRTFAWEDRFKRLLLRFERIQSRHITFKLMAYTMINLRQFCQP